MKNVRHHALGIAALLLMAVLICAAVVLREAEWSLMFSVLALAAGFHGLRYLRGLSWWAR
jgi:hypothetical protein